MGTKQVYSFVEDRVGVFNYFNDTVTYLQKRIQLTLGLTFRKRVVTNVSEGGSLMPIFVFVRTANIVPYLHR